MAAEPGDIDDTNKYFTVPQNIGERITDMKTKLDTKKQEDVNAQKEKEAEEKTAEEFQKNNPNVSGTPDNMCIDEKDKDNRCISPSTGPTGLAIGGPRP